MSLKNSDLAQEYQEGTATRVVARAMTNAVAKVAAKTSIKAESFSLR